MEVKTPSWTSKVPKFSPRQLILIAIVLIALFFLIRWIFTGKSSQRNNPKDILDEAKKAIQENQLSYPTSQYATWCDRLEAAFEDFGTDEEEVYTIFKQMKTDSDLYYLIEVFGERTYWGNFWPFDLSLPEHIYHEMDQDEIAEINRILSVNGITFQF